MAEKLSTPQNVKISSDGELTFDAVPNATSYDILANNTVIGNSEGVSTNMAEKTLKTKIQLRFDTYDKWVANNPVLKKGEVAVVQIDTKDPANKLLPPIMFKVGNGETNENGEKLRFNNLGWTSALAADVYDWAKKPEIETTVSGSGSFVSSVSWDSTNNKLSIIKSNVSGFVPTTRKVAGKALSADISADDLITALGIESGATKVTETTVGGWGFTKNKGTVTGIKMNGASQTEASDGTVDLGTVITAHQDITGKQNKTISNVSGITATTVEGALTEAKKAGTDAATALSNYKTSNDTAVGKKVDKTTTVNGHALSADITVTKSDVGLGSVENKGLDTAVTKDSGNYITSGAVKTAIDNAISGVTQFDIVKYDSFDKLPKTGKKGVIYITAHSHSDSNDSYDEYIWNTALTTPAYEKIGNTDVNLSEYVNTLSGTANSGVITNLTKSGNTLTVTSKSLVTADPAANGTALAFIDTVSQAADGKITATKKTVSDVTTTAHGLMTAADKVKLNGIAEGATKVTETTVSGWGYIKTYTDTNQTVKVGNTTFGDNTAVEIAAGSHASVTAANDKITIAAIWPTASDNGYAGINKTGTVTTVSAAANSGLKITGTASTAPTIDWDSSVTLVFDCGDSADV